MPYELKDSQATSLVDDTGSDDGTLFNRQWFIDLFNLNLNKGFFLVSTDAQPAVDVDASKSGIVAGPGVASIPDIGWFRAGVSRWQARNAVDNAFVNISAADPVNAQDLVTLAYGDANYITAAIGAALIGGEMGWGFDVDPGVQGDGSEWAILDGRALSRTTYATLNALMSAEGYKYGNGNGSTTFNIPNRQGQIPIGVGGTPALTQAQQDGDWDHTHDYSDVPQHSHSINDPGHSHGTSEGAGHGHQALMRTLTVETVSNPTFTNGLMSLDAGGAYNLQNDGSVDLVQKSVTGLSIDSAATGITGTQNTGVGSPETGPANPPVMAQNFIMRIL